MALPHFPGERRSFLVDGSPVDFYDLGAGPALVIHHGGQCTPDDFGNIAPQLALQYRLILVDRFVHEPDPWHVWLLLDHLGIDRVALLAHSAGSRWSEPMLRLRPQRVWAMIDVDATSMGELILVRQVPNDRYSPTAAALYREHGAAMQAKLAKRHQGDYPTRVTLDCRLRGYANAALSPAQRAAARPPARVIGSIPSPPPAPVPLPAEGKFVRCPALIIQTGRGKLGREDISDAWIDENIHASNVQYEVIKEAGHWPWLEDAEGFLGILEPFLAKAVAHGDTPAPG